MYFPSVGTYNLEIMNVRDEQIKIELKKRFLLDFSFECVELKQKSRKLKSTHSNSHKKSYAMQSNSSTTNLIQNKPI